MPIDRRHACAALLAAAVAPRARAQAWPSKPLRVVVGAAPGGPSDFLARLMAEQLTPLLGQPVVVENKPGASSTFAADAVAKAPADGHTLLMSGPAAITNAPFVMARLNYDPARDLVPVAVIGAGAFVLAVNAALPVRTVADLAAYAAANALPGVGCVEVQGAGDRLARFRSGGCGIERGVVTLVQSAGRHQPRPNAGERDQYGGDGEPELLHERRRILGPGTQERWRASNVSTGGCESNRRTPGSATL